MLGHKRKDLYGLKKGKRSFKCKTEALCLFLFCLNLKGRSCIKGKLYVVVDVCLFLFCLHLNECLLLPL